MSTYGVSSYRMPPLTPTGNTTPKAARRCLSDRTTDTFSMICSNPSLLSNYRTIGFLSLSDPKSGQYSRTRPSNINDLPPKKTVHFQRYTIDNEGSTPKDWNKAKKPLVGIRKYYESAANNFKVEPKTPEKPIPSNAKTDNPYVATLYQTELPSTPESDEQKEDKPILDASTELLMKTRMKEIFGPAQLKRFESFGKRDKHERPLLSSYRSSAYNAFPLI